MELWLSLIFSVIGAAYFLYGKKQSEITFMLAGGCLTFYGYFVPGVPLIILVGFVLVAAPFVAHHFGW
jgi:hypothetical protein